MIARDLAADLIEQFERRADLVLIHYGPVSELRPRSRAGRNWLAVNAPLCWVQKTLLPDSWLLSADDGEIEPAVSAAKAAGLRCTEWRVIEGAR